MSEVCVVCTCMYVSLLLKIKQVTSTFSVHVSSTHQVAEALDYLHTKNFVYRDLKPENILVWKYPIPETQWCNNSNAIYLKVADYGISKQVSPQGIRGIEGTRPYLPPEVILHGGREAYSKKLDVYAFGMFLYYLVTFMSPFEKEARPITALLEEKRRPEVPTKVCVRVHIHVCMYRQTHLFLLRA